jgi:hypothetical protein
MDSMTVRLAGNRTCVQRHLGRFRVANAKYERVFWFIFEREHLEALSLNDTVSIHEFHGVGNGAAIAITG